MKVPSAQFLVLSLAMMIATGPLAQEAKHAASPVEFPKLEKFEPLWKRSIFTTKDLPSPDAPAGPNFADNLSLSGIYEIDGGVVAVLVDRTTSQVMEARIGSENEMGIRIRKVTPGETLEKTRIQLQKGDQAGWVTFADTMAQPAEVIQRAVIPTQTNGNAAAPRMPGTSSLPQRPQPGATNSSARQAPAMPAAPNPILPPPSNPIPSAPRSTPINDVPLPPP